MFYPSKLRELQSLLTVNIQSVGFQASWGETEGGSGGSDGKRNRGLWSGRGLQFGQSSGDIPADQGPHALGVLLGGGLQQGLPDAGR